MLLNSWLSSLVTYLRKNHIITFNMLMVDKKLLFIYL